MTSKSKAPSVRVLGVRAGASDPVRASSRSVAQAARDALRRGNAVDAIVAGVLAAAAEHPAVLLGPLQVIVAGPGAGLVAFDGRVRQPGTGAPRPRGFVPGDEIPKSALVGAPALAATLAGLAASLGTRGLLRSAGAAIDIARKMSPERTAVMERLARRSAHALAEDPVETELIAAAGRPSRGLLTREDLRATVPSLIRCEESQLRPSHCFLAPWRKDGPSTSRFTRVLVTLDRRGVGAAACYEASDVGIELPDLGLVAPLLAAPVLRGVPRVRPGQPRPSAAPIALYVSSGVCRQVLGAGGCDDAEDRVLRAVTAIKG